MITGSAYFASLPVPVDDIEARHRLMHERNVATFDVDSCPTGAPITPLTAPAERWPEVLERLAALTTDELAALRADPACDRLAFLIGAPIAPDRHPKKRTRKSSTPDGA